jgi:amidase
MAQVAGVLLLALTVAATPAAAAEEGAVCVENATIGDLQEALAAGRTTAADLVRAFTARIEAYDRAGPRLNAVRELNPDALAIAEKLDARKSGKRRPLEGIPILVKDNIATGDAQHTTAGSLALADARAQRDATVVKLLRQAGAVILGKTNLTEFANILALDMPSGYSSLGGQVRNPYAPQLDGRGVPIVSPGGSSSGSAVAVAAGLAAVAIGTETSGSLLVPASGGLHEVRGIRNLPLGSGRQGDRPAGEQLIPVRDAGPNHEVPKSHFFCLGTSAKDET